MDTKAENLDKGKEKTVTKPSKHKKAEGKKPTKPTAPEIQNRGRAKSTIVSVFQSKMMQEIAVKKEKEKIESIGQERFKNLLAMFNKPTVAEEIVKEKGNLGPNKLDKNRFSAFVSNVSNPNPNSATRDNISTTGLSIKERIAMLEESNKKSALKPVDPILEEFRNRKNNEGEFSEKDDDDLSDDHLSDSDLSDSISDSSEEKIKKIQAEDIEDEDKSISEEDKSEHPGENSEENAEDEVNENLSSNFNPNEIVNIEDRINENVNENDLNPNEVTQNENTNQSPVTSEIIIDETTNTPLNVVANETRLIHSEDTLKEN